MVGNALQIAASIPGALVTDQRKLSTGRKTIWRPGADDNVDPIGQNRHVALMQHALEYTLIWGLQFPYPVMVWGTEAMTDRDVLRFIRDENQRGNIELHFDAAWRLRNYNFADSTPLDYIRIERIQQCPVCHTWSPCMYLNEGRVPFR